VRACGARALAAGPGLLRSEARSRARRGAGAQEEVGALRARGLQDDSYAYVACMAVARRERRRGAASALLAAAERVAGKWAQNWVLLHVYCNNFPAQRLYHRNRCAAAPRMYQSMIVHSIHVVIGDSRSCLAQPPGAAIGSLLRVRQFALRVWSAQGRPGSLSAGCGPACARRDKLQSRCCCAQVCRPANRPGAAPARGQAARADGEGRQHVHGVITILVNKYQPAAALAGAARTVSSLHACVNEIADGAHRLPVCVPFAQLHGMLCIICASGICLVGIAQHLHNCAPLQNGTCM